MRMKLKLLRTEHNLTQEEMAQKLGVTRQHYSAVEKGKAIGSMQLWANLQDTFNLKDDEVWKMQRNI